MEAAHRRGTERLILAIGAISASSRTVLTPAGSAPVNAVSWALREEASSRGRVWRRTPAAAPGSVLLTVKVSGPDWEHVEQVGPVTREDAAAVRAKVTQARMLALRSVVWSLSDPLPLPAAQVPGEQMAPAR
jgi:hypothetical protein